MDGSNSTKGLESPINNSMERPINNQRKRLPVSVSAAVFIENDQGELLLVKQASETKGRKWGPPAGGMEAHEDPLMAARREVKEEIDVEVELLNILGIYTVDRGDDKSGIGFVFRGRISSGEIMPKNDEIADYGFFSRKDLRKLIVKNQIYKPEYNLPGIHDWIERKEYPLGVIQSIG